MATHIPASKAYSAGNWVFRQFHKRNLLVCGTAAAAGVALVRSSEFFKQRKHFNDWVFRLPALIVNPSPQQKVIGKVFVLSLVAVAVCSIASRVRPLLNGPLSFQFEQVSDQCVTAFVGMGSFVGSVYLSSTYQLCIKTTPPFLTLEKCKGKVIPAAPLKQKIPKVPIEVRKRRAIQIAQAAADNVLKKKALEKSLQERPEVLLPDDLWEGGIFHHLFHHAWADEFCEQFKTTALVCKTWRNLLYSIDKTLSFPSFVCKVSFAARYKGFYSRKIVGYPFDPIKEELIRFPCVSFDQFTLNLGPYDDQEEVGKVLTSLMEQDRLKHLSILCKEDSASTQSKSLEEEAENFQGYFRKIQSLLQQIKGSLDSLSIKGVNPHSQFSSFFQDNSPSIREGFLSVEKLVLDEELIERIDISENPFPTLRMRELESIAPPLGKNLTTLLEGHTELKKLTLISEYIYGLRKDFSFRDCSLESLSVDLYDVDSTSLKNALASQHALKKLKLKYMIPHGKTSIDVETFAANPIEELYLTGYSTRSERSHDDLYTEGDLEDEENLQLFLQNMRCLRKLHLYDMEMTGWSLEGLQLEELILEQCDTLELELLTQVLRNMQTLKKLTIKEFPVTYSKAGFTQLWPALIGLPIEELIVDQLSRKESQIFFQEILLTLSLKKLCIKNLELPFRCFEMLKQLISLGPEVIEIKEMGITIESAEELEEAGLSAELLVELKKNGVETLYLNTLKLKEEETVQQFRDRIETAKREWRKN